MEKPALIEINWSSYKKYLELWEYFSGGKEC